MSDRLAEIEARWAAATPGPWASDHSGVWTMADSCAGGPILDPCSPGDPKDGIGRVGDPYPRGGNHPTENMRAIAAAPDDIAWLVAEVKRLSAPAEMARVLRGQR